MSTDIIGVGIQSDRGITHQEYHRLVEGGFFGTVDMPLLMYRLEQACNAIFWAEARLADFCIAIHPYDLLELERAADAFTLPIYPPQPLVTIAGFPVHITAEIERGTFELRSATRPAYTQRIDIPYSSPPLRLYDTPYRVSTPMLGGHGSSGREPMLSKTHTKGDRHEH